MSGKNFLAHIVCVIFLTIMALGLVWIRTERIRLGYTFSQAYKVLAELGEVNKKLRLEWEYLTGYTNLSRIASKEFNMHPPRSSDILFVITEK
ncbi:MAG: cell division protein FtsL [Deltaproteobacteria bacterium]|nr:cell division protein FtsL [Deltaproteobacteria bacterium]MBW2068575.1 cell division protein FtsL [Deltaproteobacteria bacterium]